MEHNFLIKRKAVPAIAAIVVSSILITANSSPLPLLAGTSNVFAIEQPLQNPMQPGIDEINSGPQPTTDKLNLTQGYIAEAVAWNLTLPTSVTFDGNGSMYIAESGYIYGELKPQPRILKVDQNGNLSAFVDRLLSEPVNDIEFNTANGLLYVSHRGMISTVDAGGLVNNIIIGLPSMGDHHNNEIEFGPDGRLYVTIGVLTNSGVIGQDNILHGWGPLMTTLHDVPGQDITLTGQNFESSNPLTPADPNDNATTGAFVPFGNTTTEGQVVKGNPLCNGCVISANLDGSDIQLEAWGLRNPFGLEFNNEGRLFASDNGADERGIRPIMDDDDKFQEIRLNANEPPFYGWPDFFGNAEPVTDPKFQSPRANSTQLQFLMQNHPEVERPLALIDHAAAATGVEFTDDAFGLQGKALVGEFGTIAPATHSPHGEIQEALEGRAIIGQKVIALDLNTGNYTDFISLNVPDLSFRPVGLTYNEDENALYIVTIGKAEVKTQLPSGEPLPYPIPWAYPFTGVIWKITMTDTGADQTETETVSNQMSASNATDMTSNNTTAIDILTGG
jgi:glucose/arabinose dehydrogenase